MTFTIDELFTPVPSGVTQGGATTPSTNTWLAQLLSGADTLSLPTTAWQSGGATRTILALVANMLAQEDVLVSMMAQGGFLDFAASGTVTFVGLNGIATTQPVSPDPSIPGQNPTGKPTWLDVLASCIYDVLRLKAQYASGTLAIANTTASPAGPYVAGTYHVVNATTGAGFSNTGSLTIAAQNLVGGGIQAASPGPGITITTNSAHGLTNSDVVYIADVVGTTAANGFWTITRLSATQFILNGSPSGSSYISGGTVNVCTLATIQADNAGAVGTSGPKAITQAVTTVTGVLVSNPTSLYGAAAESNTALVERCRLKLQALSVGGPEGAYEYYAKTASQILSAATPPVQLTVPINRATATFNPVTGAITTTIANASGAVTGVSNLAVSGASLASPIEITTAAHPLNSGDFVTISGVLGNTNANGTWNITVTSGTAFTLNASTGNAAYVSGGIVEGGDLGEVDRVIQENVVPLGMTAYTQSATPFAITLAGNVVVPQGQVATYQAGMQTALPTYFAGLKIGGGDAGMLDYEGIVAQLGAIGSINGQGTYVISMSGITLNGSSVDLSYPSAISVATIAAINITVTGA